MRVNGRLKDVQYTINNRLVVSFEVTDKAKALRELDAIKDCLLVIDASKEDKKKSSAANRYFWELATQIATVLLTDKESVYISLLYDYGQSIVITTEIENIDDLKKQYRLVDVLEVGKVAHVRCYRGLSTYTQSEISYLIQNTELEAEALGIVTKTKQEVEAIIKAHRTDRG